MRSAIFVDAGYLYAQGSVALGGQKLNRARVTLNLHGTITKLRDESAIRTNHAPLLRIYWYDGLSRGELSRDQQHLAFMEDVKLRLGIVNQAGQQKGVDSLIVTDLVELARNHAITDAVLLSGDEDLRIGVQIAQSYGVRVHLIGIEPSRGSQSLSLLQEADTTTEWNRDALSKLMNLAAGFDGSDRDPGDKAWAELHGDTAATLKQLVDQFVSSLDLEDIKSIADLGETERVPPQFDSRLLASCRAGMGGDLDYSEKVQMRKIFKEQVRKRLKVL